MVLGVDIKEGMRPGPESEEEEARVELGDMDNLKWTIMERLDIYFEYHIFG